MYLGCIDKIQSEQITATLGKSWRREWVKDDSKVFILSKWKMNSKSIGMGHTTHGIALSEGQEFSFVFVVFKISIWEIQVEKWINMLIICRDNFGSHLHVEEVCYHVIGWPCQDNECWPRKESEKNTNLVLIYFVNHNCQRK